jgi:putative SOS response-associated peptidase YedK
VEERKTRGTQNAVPFGACGFESHLRHVCGRFTLTDPDPRILRIRFDLSESAKIAEEPRFNIAPTDPVLAVREFDDRREPGRLRWGLVPPGTTPKEVGRPLINARRETVDRQPAFRGAFGERRCLIPSDGFYEWQVTEDGKRPLWISLPDQQLFSFAGLWSRSHDDEGEELHSCAIVTCEPSDQMRPIHDRMPVILPGEAEAEWLAEDAESESLMELLRPRPRVLEMREVGEFVNDVRNDGPHLIESREPDPKLF